MPYIHSSDIKCNCTLTYNTNITNVNIHYVGPNMTDCEIKFLLGNINLSCGDEFHTIADLAFIEVHKTTFDNVSACLIIALGTYISDL